jgi:hypothetical protein
MRNQSWLCRAAQNLHLVIPHERGTMRWAFLEKLFYADNASLENVEQVSDSLGKLKICLTYFFDAMYGCKCVMG